MLKIKKGDIGMLTSRGSYHVTIQLEDVLPTIDRYVNKFGGYGLQLDPDFQRGVVWNEDQQIAFIEYILKGGTTTIYLNKPDWGGFTSLESNVDKNKYYDFVCMDGLQRLTSMLKFMNKQLKAFNCYVDEIDKSYIRGSEILININNLKTKKEVLKFYLDFNSGGTIHTAEELSRVKAFIKELR